MNIISTGCIREVDPFTFKSAMIDLKWSNGVKTQGFLLMGQNH